MNMKPYVSTRANRKAMTSPEFVNRIAATSAC
jgi:hypothetical protein